MYLFSDPDDPSIGTSTAGTPPLVSLAMVGYLNETFNDDDINCTIKLRPNQPQPGVYAKRDIYLHEELFTGYGKPQWIYTLFFFPHHLSLQTLQALRQRYQLPIHITAEMVRIIQPEDIPLLPPAGPPLTPDQ